MSKKLFALAAGTLALLVVAGTFDPADARSRGGGRGFHGGGHARAFSGRVFSSRGFHVRRSHRALRRGIFVGVPLAAYGAYYYADGCGRLRRRALATGSGYWWDRYYACRDGYY